MQDNMKMVIWFGFGLLLVAMAIFLSSRSVFSQGLGNCGTGWVAKDESSPFEYNGEVRITKVIVKAGSQNQGDACFEYTQNGDDGCYALQGLGGFIVQVWKTGDGKDCKDISHVEFYGEVIPTPIAEPSETPVATASALPSPNIIPSPTAGASATPVSSTTPTSAPTEAPKSEEKKEESKSTGTSSINCYVTKGGLTICN